MKKYVVAGCVLLMAAALSCTREMDVDKPAGQEYVFEAVWADGSDTRTAIQENGTSVWWTTGEEINIFYGAEASGKFTSTNTEPVQLARFSGTLPVVTGTVEVGNGPESFWGVYPYDASNTCDGESVTLTVPSTQVGTEGTFADKFFPAVGRSGDFAIAFYNVCGGLRFSVANTGIESVTFQAIGGESLVGKVKVAFGTDGKPAIQQVTDGCSEVIVTAPAGGFVPGKYYFAAFLPGTLSQGLKVTYLKGEQSVEITLDTQITVNRSRFGTLENKDEGFKEIITFADAKVKAILVANFDTDEDGEISMAEARAVEHLGTIFQFNKEIVFFDELQYFSNLQGIDNGAFWGCTNLTSIILPNSISSIAENAFIYCKSLTEMNIPESVNTIDVAFFGCDNLRGFTGKFVSSDGRCLIIDGEMVAFAPAGLTEYAIPDGVTAIKGYVFLYSKEIKHIILPDGLVRIYPCAFEGCAKLERFSGQYATGDGRAVIIDGKMVAFAPSGLTSYTVPAGVELEDSVFLGCETIETIVLPSGLKAIPRSAFAGCYRLTNLTIPNSVILIGALAFNDCSRLTTITIPSGVTQMGASVFMSSGVSSIYVKPTTPPVAGLGMFEWINHSFTIYVPAQSLSLYQQAENWRDYADHMVGVEVGVEAVDLGLPSGLKWASCNLGASNPEEYGDYYAWGEIEPKENYYWSTYKWCVGSNDTMTKYCTDSSIGYNGFTDGKTVLDLEDDAAYVNLGGEWRMPMKEEQDELLDKCSWEWAPMNSVNGYKVTGPNGNSIFLPAAGFRHKTSLRNTGFEIGYWSSTDYGHGGYGLFFNSSIDSHPSVVVSGRYVGHSVRAVYGPRPVPVESVSLNRTELEVFVGQTATLTASIFPENATNKAVSWSSNNESVATVSSTGVVTGVSTGSATITVITVNGEKTATCEVTVKSGSSATPVPEAVDLGLSIKWASCNLGASKPEEYGNYYAWGETEPKESFGWEGYKFYGGHDMNGTKLTKYVREGYNAHSDYYDNKDILDYQDDAARQTLGGKWRIPTLVEQEELRENCFWEWTGGGYTITGPNGNSIFLPAAGILGSDFSKIGYQGGYWSSCIQNEPYNPYFAWGLYFYILSSPEVIEIWSHSRMWGLSIRPVTE